MPIARHPLSSSSVDSKPITVPPHILSQPRSLQIIAIKPPIEAQITILHAKYNVSQIAIWRDRWQSERKHTEKAQPEESRDRKTDS